MTKKAPKKGGYYSFNGALATGAADWTHKSEMGDSSISDRGGNTQYGRGRKRKGKKVTKRKMKGGGSYGAPSASFTGTGSRGLADYGGVDTRVFGGPAAGGEFNNFGGKPGNFSNFITTKQ